MSPERLRPTPAGWAALSAAGLLLVGGLTVIVVAVTRPPDCTVRSGARMVALDRGQAEKAATAVAAVVRRGSGPAAASRAVADAATMSPADARAVATALSGRAPAALACRYGGASASEPDKLDRQGLTGRAEAVRQDLLSRFGPLALGGYAPGGVHSGHMPGSAHYEGRAIDVFFRPVSRAHRQLGWAVAQYLVAHADRLAVNTVIFDARIWTAGRADEGWRDYRADLRGRSRAAARVLEHRDHVHVDVAD